MRRYISISQIFSLVQTLINKRNILLLYYEQETRLENLASAVRWTVKWQENPTTTAENYFFCIVPVLLCISSLAFIFMATEKLKSNRNIDFKR